MRRWWNWQEYLAAEHPGRRATFEAFEALLRRALRRVHVRVRRARSPGSTRRPCAQVAELVAGAGTRLVDPHLALAPPPATWAAGRWRARLFLLNALLGAVATPGGTYPNAWNKFVPRPIHTAAAPARTGTS